MAGIDPRDLIQALANPQVSGWLKKLSVAASHDVTLGRVLGYGAGINDTFVNRDNVDATHPMNLSYLVPTNAQRVVSARLSWRLHAYRTYNSLTVSATGTESAGHTHGSAAHHHTMFQDNGTNFATPPNLEWWKDGNANLYGLGAGGFDAVTFNTTPSATGGESGAHTHTISGSSVLGITEGATATGITISFDGVDRTAALGGPWSTDVVELDVTPFLTLNPTGAWHLVSMGSATLGQIESHLRLSFYADAGGLA